MQCAFWSLFHSSFIPALPFTCIPHTPTPNFLFLILAFPRLFYFWNTHQYFLHTNHSIMTTPTNCYLLSLSLALFMRKNSAVWIFSRIHLLCLFNCTFLLSHAYKQYLFTYISLKFCWYLSPVWIQNSLSWKHVHVCKRDTIISNAVSCRTLSWLWKRLY